MVKYYFNLHGKVFKEPKEDSKWYNLETGRIISKKPQNRSHFILCDDPKIAGSQQMIDLFFSMNDIESDFVQNKSLIRTETKDVEDLTDEQIDTLKNFDIFHPKIKLRIVDVKDEIITGIAFISFAILSAQNLCFSNNLTSTDGMFVKISCICKDELNLKRKIIYCKILGIRDDGKYMISIY